MYLADMCSSRKISSSHPAQQKLCPCHDTGEEKGYGLLEGSSWLQDYSHLRDHHITLW